MSWRVWLMAILTVLLAVAYGVLNRAEFLRLSPAGGFVDLSRTIGGDWDRMCILSPYTTNPMAHEVLGTHLNVELRSRIYSSDSIALLVTLQDGEVDELYEVSRGDVDFAHLGGQCFPRGAAQFEVVTEGHPMANPRP